LVYKFQSVALELDVEELGNNRYRINGELIYAPNIEIAIKRYEKKYGNEGE